MTHPTRINPILYNRLQYALTDIIGGVQRTVTENAAVLKFDTNELQS